MEMLTNYLGAVAFDLLNVNVVACAVLFVVALTLGILIAAVRCKVVYVDSEDGSVIHEERHGWLTRAYIHGATKDGKRLVGWSKSKDGSKILHKNQVVMVATLKLFAIWEDAQVVEDAPKRKEVVKELDYAEGMFIQFNYVDAEANETVATQGFRINGKLPDEDNEELVVEGWSFEPNGEVVVSKEETDAVFTIDLYPVFGETELGEEFDGEAVVEIAYVDSSSNTRVYKESHYVTLDLPADYISNPKLVGWAIEPNGAVVIERGEGDSIFTIELCSVGNQVVEKKPVLEEIVTEEPTTEVVEKSNTVVVVDEPIVEEVTEEEVVVEEVIVEEPVVEEVIVEEPVVEEVIVEEPVVEPVYDYVFEEIVEEPIVEEVTEETVVEETVIEEKVYEEPIVEEVVTEEVVEEPVVEEVIVEEPVVEETVVEETVVEETVVEETVVEEVVTEVVDTEHTPVIVPTYYDNEGNKIDIKYSRSFTANVIQSEETVKQFYSELKNHILSYKGVKSRISWKFDSYNKGRDQLFKMKLRGKTICLYCALNPDEFDKSRYHHEAIDAKIFEDVPMLVKVKSGLGLRKAKEIVDIEMAKFGIVKDEKAKTVDYVALHPYEETEALLARKLVKALVSDSDVVVVSNKVKDEVEEPIVETVVEEPIVEEVVTEETVVEEVIVEEPVVEEVVEETVIEEKVYEEPVVEETVVEEPIVEETIVEEVVVEEPIVEETVVEEVVVEEPIVEETVVEEVIVEEPVVEEVVTEEVVIEEHVYVDSVTAEEAHVLAEVNHIEVVVEEDVEYISKGDNKKCVVNIDTLSKEFNAGDVVDLAALKAKKLVDKKAKSVKVLARGRLDKPLTVKAGDFSNTALEMITLTGGHAIHVTYKVK